MFCIKNLKVIEALLTSQNWSRWSRSFPSLFPSLSKKLYKFLKAQLSLTISQKRNNLFSLLSPPPSLSFSRWWGFQLGIQRFSYQSCLYTYFPFWVLSETSFCVFSTIWGCQVFLKQTIFGPTTRSECPATRLYQLPFSGKSCLSSSSRIWLLGMVVVVTCRRVVLFVCMSLRERMRSGGWRIVSTFFTGLVWTVGWIMIGKRVHFAGTRLCLMRCRKSLINGYGLQIMMLVIFTVSRVHYQFSRELGFFFFIFNCGCIICTFTWKFGNSAKYKVFFFLLTMNICYMSLNSYD